MQVSFQAFKKVIVYYPDSVKQSILILRAKKCANDIVKWCQRSLVAGNPNQTHFTQDLTHFLP